MLAWCALAAALSSSPAPKPSVPPGPDRGDVRRPAVEATLVRVDFRRHVLTVAVPAPASREYDLVMDDTTELVQDGRALVAADLPLGDVATVSWTEDAHGNRRARLVVVGRRTP
jgi:hypothetical protein